MSDTLKVRGDTAPAKLAKSIVETLREQGGRVRVRAMGPTSVNQAVKGIIIARSMLAAEAKDIEMIPSFQTTTECGDEITVIVFTLVEFGV